jgi:hypothetical protein
VFEYLLFINFKIVSLPDCKGIWKCGTIVLDFDTKSIILFDNKFGSIEDIRIRIFLILSISFNK